MASKAIPDGYHNVTPYLVVQGADKLLDFVTRAFDAKPMHRMPHPDGGIMHAEVKIGDSIVMMGEARGTCQPMPCSLYLYVTDADAVYKQALQAGRPINNGTHEPVWGLNSGRKGPGGQPVDDRHSQGGCPARRVTKACRGSHEATRQVRGSGPLFAGGGAAPAGQGRTSLRSRTTRHHGGCPWSQSP